MGKETSTDEKRSAREARHARRSERISFRDSDSSKTNDTVGSLSVNAPDVKQGARRSVRKERNSFRDSDSSKTNDSKYVPDGSLSFNAPDGKQGSRRSVRKIPKKFPRDCDDESNAGSFRNEAVKPGSFAVVPDGSLLVNDYDGEPNAKGRRSYRKERNSKRNMVSGDEESNAGTNGSKRFLDNDLDGEQDAKARRSYRKERKSSRKLVSGELDASKEGSNGREAEKSGAVGAVAFIRDKSDRNLTEDNRPNLVVASECAPDTADLEAQANEIKKQLLQDVTAAEVVGRRRCACILFGLLVVGVVVGILAALSETPTVSTMPTIAPTATGYETLAPTASPTIFSTSSKFTQMLNITSAVTSDIKILQDPTTFQYAALNWLANVDSWWVDVDSVPPQVFVERYVLALLFFSTNGTSWRNDLNFLSPTPVCDWSGVTCDGIDGIYGFDYVWRLDIDDNAMQGEIPTELALLTSLNRMNFNKNLLFGTIPLEIYNLTNLVSLWMEDNALSGTLSTEVGTMPSLTSLDLDNNDFHGTLPTEIGMLADLFEFELSYNNIDGTLPTEIQMMTSLDRIGVRWNNFGGSIPTELGYLTDLFVLDLEGNVFQGTIPTELGLLTGMQYFFIGMNLLEGQLPSELGRLEALEQFFVHDNRLTGSVPELYHNLTNLEYFWFQGNDFRGSVDSIFCINPFVREDLRGDCLGDSPEITCTCCQNCCTADGETCEQP